MTMREPSSSFSHGDQRRATGERRQSSPRSLYDRLDDTLRTIEDRRRSSGRRRDDGPARQRRMSLDEALRLAGEVARAENPDFVVVGLTGADGSTGYVEMLIAIKGCHVEPCRLAIGFDRTIAPARLRETIQRRIREHLRERPH
jgi:hypothetical protein